MSSKSSWARTTGRDSPGGNAEPPRARLGRYEDLTVTIALDVDYIVDPVGELDTRLEANQLTKIERLIAKDHEFHEKRT